VYADSARGRLPLKQGFGHPALPDETAHARAKAVAHSPPRSAGPWRGGESRITPLNNADHSLLPSRDDLFARFQTELLKLRRRQPTRSADGFFWRDITEL
jgi:hypothetical protein